MTQKRLMLVMAHPDDAEFSAGGLMTLWHQAGHRIKILCLTNGKRRPPHPEPRRTGRSTTRRSATSRRISRCGSGHLAGRRRPPHAMHRTERKTHRCHPGFCTEPHRDSSHSGLSPGSSSHRATCARQRLSAAGSIYRAGTYSAVTDAEHLTDLRPVSGSTTVPLRLGRRHGQRPRQRHPTAGLPCQSGVRLAALAAA